MCFVATAALTALAHQNTHNEDENAHRLVALLGSRASQPITLFYAGVPVEDELAAVQ